MTLPLASSAIAVALSTALATGAPAQTPSQTISFPTVHTVHEQVEAYFADIPIMAKIAGCESHFRQFDTDGSVYRGEQNHLDVGVMQINEHYHLETAKSLGYDLNTIDGNMAYARYLYQHEGTAPWVSSAYCWNTNGKEFTTGDHWEGAMNTTGATLASANNK